MPAVQGRWRPSDLLVSRDSLERFHFTLYEASGSSWLVRSIWPLWRNSERYRGSALLDTQGHIDAETDQHLRMIEALESGDGASAVRSIVEHLTMSYELVASALSAEEEGASRRKLPTADDLI
jgi:DNA-binding GntR family transcriptional regulator